MIDTAVRDRSDALVRTLLESVRIASVSMTGEGIAVAYIGADKVLTRPQPRRGRAVDDCHRVTGIRKRVGHVAPEEAAPTDDDDPTA